MLIDIHAHLNFKEFDKDREEVIKRSLDNNVWMVNVGTNYLSSKKVVEIAQNYPKGVYAAVGLHPINIKQDLRLKIKDSREEDILEEEFDYGKYKDLAKSEKVVAIGEIGLDYWSKPKTKRKITIFKEKQKTYLCQQLNLAKELSLPVIFHCRLAHDDLLKILNKFQVSGFRIQGVIHCFTGSWEQAKKYLKMGFYLGFNGIIFKLDLDEIIKKMPLERILIETDCPFLVPPAASAKALTSQARNEPLYVKYIAQKIAEIKGEAFGKIAQTTTQNAKKLFGL